jgi:hypothetical protein
MADAGLEGALLGCSAAGLHAAAAALLGSGEGLTPAGDDVLIGAVSSFGLLGRAVGNRPSGALLHSVAPTLVENARRRTTLLSASLLRHACSGRVAAGIAALLSALGGWGDLDRAVDGVLSLGHSSGPALAFGVVAGARAVCGGP